MQAEVLLHYSKHLAKCFTTYARQFQNLICQDAHSRSGRAMGFRGLDLPNKPSPDPLWIRFYDRVCDCHGDFAARGNLPKASQRPEIAYAEARFTSHRLFAPVTERLPLQGPYCNALTGVKHHSSRKGSQSHCHFNRRRRTHSAELSSPSRPGHHPTCVLSDTLLDRNCIFLALRLLLRGIPTATET
jgi:hypothetical protein